MVAPAVSVTGQTVVETTIVSVVTNVVLELAGQSGTVEGHAVMVAVRVDKTVEVVDCNVEDPLGDDSEGMELVAIIAVGVVTRGVEERAEEVDIARDEGAEQ